MAKSRLSWPASWSARSFRARKSKNLRASWRTSVHEHAFNLRRTCVRAHLEDFPERGHIGGACLSGPKTPGPMVDTAFASSIKPADFHPAAAPGRSIQPDENQQA